MTNDQKTVWLLIIIIIFSLTTAQCSATPNLNTSLRNESPAIEEKAGATSDNNTPTDPITLRINLGSEPPTLDPGLATDTTSVNIIQNIFVGLTTFDPDTGDVTPYLASRWDVSEDGLQWIFYLLDNVPWIHYNPLTAESKQVYDEAGAPRFVSAYDIEYAVKRNVNPDSASDYAYVLYIIKNAAAVNSGQDKEGNVTDLTVDDIGVQALDAHTLKFTLEQPAGYFPAIAALWMLKPLPAWTIEKWGDKWTEAGLINTSGPYALAEWIHGSKITLAKNPLWINAGQVQIDVVDALMIAEASTEFALYEGNELDTAKVPLTDIDRIKADPNLNQELLIKPKLCTYYYGFTHTKPPFDDARVRRAFSAAIDRQTLVENVAKGGQIPATTFAPPGIFGASEPGKLGQGYDPELAQNSLQEFLDDNDMTLQEFNAGYNIVLGHNTSEGHARIASAIQQMWKETLGVTVSIENQEWRVYLQTLQKTTPVEEVFHIWRTGWCADYPDENNWVHEVFNSQFGANRLRRRCADPNCESLLPPDKFDQLTIAAAQSTNVEERLALYAEAENILAREEAAYAPIYHYTEAIVTKPWLKRNFPALGGDDYYNWRIDSIQNR